MKKYLISAGIGVIVLIGIVLWTSRVTHLDPPLLKVAEAKTDKQLSITGVAYPKAQLAVYVDDQFLENITVSPDGSFQGEIDFSQEGQREIKIKQLYGNVSSEFSDPVTVEVDLTPPDKNSFKLSSVIPNFSKQSSLEISGRASPSDQVLVSGTSYPVNSDGSFSGTFILKNGENILNFSLRDEVGNTILIESHKVTVDNIPPKVTTGFCGSKTLSGQNFLDLSSGQEYVCIYTGQWEDWRDPAPIPIVGFALGDIDSITVEGKRINVDENDEIYQRVFLSVPKGLNKYRVVVTDKFGNQTNTTLTMTVESISHNGYDDVIDRLDDLESQIDDLE